MGLRKLEDINKATLMKLVWSFLAGEDELGKILRFKFLDRNGDIIKRYKKSTIWLGIKVALKEVIKRSQWIVFNEEKVDFSHLNWASTQLLKEAIDIQGSVLQ